MNRSFDFSIVRSARVLASGIIACVALVLAFSASSTACAQEKKAQPSPADSAMISSAGADMKVYYCRPSKKGREVFGKLVPYNAVWRTGANAATEIVFSKDVNFGGKTVKAGRYALFTIPTEKKWTPNSASGAHTATTTKPTLCAWKRP
jgi:Protein of unknown function (DUF2911)